MEASAMQETPLLRKVIHIDMENTPPGPNCVIAQRGFELLNPGTQARSGKRLAPKVGAIGA
jgi:hypothetical protein